MLDGILTLPMVMPPTVAGFLLLLFSRRRPVGAFLFEEFGFKVVQTWMCDRRDCNFVSADVSKRKSGNGAN